METKLQPGQQVVVSAYGGKRRSVVVVEDRGDVVLICGIDEFLLAKAENREAMTIGLHRGDVIELIAGPPRKGIATEMQAEHRGSKAGD